MQKVQSHSMQGRLRKLETATQQGITFFQLFAVHTGLYFIAKMLLTSRHLVKYVCTHNLYASFSDNWLARY